MALQTVLPSAPSLLKRTRCLLDHKAQLPAGSFLYQLNCLVSIVIVDHNVGAETSNVIKVGRARGCDNFESTEACELDRIRSNGAGATPDKDGSSVLFERQL